MALLPESQRESHQIVNEFLHTRAPGDGSMMLSGQSSGLAAGSELQNIHSSLTPGNIRASARREIGISDKKSMMGNEQLMMMSRSGQVARAKTNSQSGFQVQQTSAMVQANAT